MNLIIEEKHTEYFIVSVEENAYNWPLHGREETREPWQTIDRWCELTWGEQGIWGGDAGPWKRMGPRYFFQTDEERMMFILRWA